MRSFRAVGSNRRKGGKMRRDAFELIATVHDEASFVEFLEALADDYEDGEEIWQNTTIDSLLDRAAAWAKDSKDGLPLVGYVPESNPWRRCAHIIHCGKIYE